MASGPQVVLFRGHSVEDFNLVQPEVYVGAH